MRNLFLSLTLASLAFAQDAPAPPKPVEPEAQPVVKVDPWTVEKPESNPEGEPVDLKVSMDPKVVHDVRAGITQNISVMGQQTKIEHVIGLKLQFKEVGDDGASFEMRVDLQKIAINGMDQTAMVKSTLSDPKFTGKFDKKGNVVSGSVTGSGLATLANQLKAAVNWVLPFAGNRRVRKGEVWEVAPVDFAPRVQGTTGGDVSGNVYMKLIGLEEVDGTKCAHIEIVFGLTIKNADITTQMGPQKGTVRIKGTVRELCGLDGVLRSREVKSKVIIEMGGMTVTDDGESKVEASPAAAVVEKAEGCGCGGCGCGGCGCGEMGGGG